MNLTKDIGLQLSERKSTQQTGQRADLLEKETIYQIAVFLPGTVSTPAFPNYVESTRPATNEPVITDTGQETNDWHLLDDSISFLDDLLAPIVQPVQSAHQGELNTPTIGEFRVKVGFTGEFLSGKMTKV